MTQLGSRTTPTSLSAGLSHLDSLQRLVEDSGACALPGVSIVYDRFIPILRRAVARGFVASDKADYVATGLRWGFGLGVDCDKLRGRVRFRNYPTALEARRFVSKATRARVAAGKTICLGRFTWAKDKMRLPWDDLRIFPLGAVPKPLEPDEMRPVSDHSKTQLNAASDLSFLRHSLDAYNEIAQRFKYGFSMRVSDVDAAFPLLPLMPRLWRFFLFSWFDLEKADDDPTAGECLYAHLCGDFGAAGLPGTFKMFFADCVCGMARSEAVLTLPLVVYVDDMGHMGPCHHETDAEGVRFKEWLRLLGIFLKELKEKVAATLQLMLGFWWDSIARTRTLEERKFKAYTDMLFELSSTRTMSLRDMQRVAGRMMRAVMTLPPGAACFLANLFALMRGLVLPWQQRRTSRALRMDFKVLYDLLNMNLGKGYFAFDQFARVPDIDTDASKESRYAGGGYASRCGRYRFWRYGANAARRLIDFLEGDTVVVAMEDIGPTWRQCIVRFNIDNSAFQQSAVKGWSRAERLTLLLRRVFTLSLNYGFIAEYRWLSTHTNVYADALSRRDGEQRFLTLVQETDFLVEGAELRRDPRSGGVRLFGPEYSSDDMGDGPWVQSPCCTWGFATQCTVCFGTRCSVCGEPFKACFDLDACEGCTDDENLNVLSHHDEHLAWQHRLDAEGQQLEAPMMLASHEAGFMGPLDTPLQPSLPPLPPPLPPAHGVDAPEFVMAIGEPVGLYMGEAPLGPDDDVSDALWDEATDVETNRDFDTSGSEEDGDTDDDSSSEEENGVHPVWTFYEPGGYYELAGSFEHEWGDNADPWAEYAQGLVETEVVDDAEQHAAQVPALFPVAAPPPLPPLPQPLFPEVDFGLPPPPEDEDATQPAGAMRLRGSGPAAGSGNLQALTVSYSRASVYTGMSADIASEVDNMLDNRLSKSAMRSMSAALVRWDTVRQRHAWPRIIASDDELRGNKMATLLISLVRDTELVAASISNYIWALRSWMKLQRQLDPVYGVIEWAELMDSAMVLAHVPAEPRKAVPLSLLSKAMATVNEHVFWEVQCAHLINLLLFSFSRSESPLPKAFTGEEQFDPAKNLMVKDFKVNAADGTSPASVQARMKATKTDQRSERPEAAGNEDWVMIGDVDDPAFSMMRWTQLLFALHGGRRDSDTSFYLDRDRRRPYLYGKALSDFRTLLARVVEKEEAYSYGLHGLRVSGYDLARRHDEELAVAHGGWKSTAHKRYSRFSLAEVRNLSAAIVRMAEVDDNQPRVEIDAPAPATRATGVERLAPVPRPDPVERVVGRGRVVHRLGSARRANNEQMLLRSPRSASSSSSPDAAAPVSPPPDLRPLFGGRRDVGRRVLIPRSLWPEWECDERDGDGWVAEVKQCLRGRATVRCVHAADDDGRAYEADLDCKVLRPV